METSSVPAPVGGVPLALRGILPVLVAATQFLISWIGMRGSPPNPQMQTITYLMPAMFLIFFINVAAGLILLQAFRGVRIDVTREER